MGSEEHLLGWFLAAGGAFSLCAAVLDWNWFMNHRKAQRLVKWFGRGGARVFYGLLGTGLVVLGVLVATGVLQSPR